MQTTTLITFEPDRPLTAKMLRPFLDISHDDTPILIKIGDNYVAVREIRQVGFEPGSPIAKVLVPVDFSVKTK